MELVSGPWDRHRVEAWLEAARIPVRLATTTARGPLVVSLWFRFEDGTLWCATSASADVVTHVRRHPRVGVEVAPDVPPYRGVRGTGRATVVPDRGVQTLDALLDRYLEPVNAQLAAWLRARADDEVALRIDELRLTSWDFSSRMAAQEGPVLPDPSDA